MPATNAGNDTARLKASQTSQSGRQDPPAPPQSRRKSTPPLSRLARASQSRRPRNARQPACRRQIPIDRTGRTAAPNPPAVSSPEACPTPADRARRTRLYPAGVRQPLYGAFVVKNVCRAVHVFLSSLPGLRIRFPRPAAVEMTIRGEARFRARSPRTTLYSVAPGGAVP